jgi:hypothetical protein
MDFTKQCEGAGWIHLAQDMVQLQAHVSRVKNKEGFQASHTQLMYVCSSVPRSCDNNNSVQSATRPQQVSKRWTSERQNEIKVVKFLL